MSTVPWSYGRLLVWEPACTAPSILAEAVTETDAIAAQVYNLILHLDSPYMLIPVIETCVWSFWSSFFKDFGWCLKAVTEDHYSSLYSAS